MSRENPFPHPQIGTIVRHPPPVCGVDTLTWIEWLPRTISPNLGGGPLLAASSQGAGDGTAHAAGMLANVPLSLFSHSYFSLDLRTVACHHGSSTPDL